MENDNDNSESHTFTALSGIKSVESVPETPESSIDFYLETNRTKASLASSEHLTPMTRSNDNLSKIEFLKSKISFINDEVMRVVY